MGPPSIKKVLCNFFLLNLSLQRIYNLVMLLLCLFLLYFMKKKTDHNFKVTKKSYRGSAITLSLDNNNNNNNAVSYRRGPLAILSTRSS